jgi:hypothetical protein
MKRKRKTFRPVMDTMEARIALSSSNWLSDFFDSLFGQSTTNDSTDKPKYTPAQIAKAHVRKLAAQEARQERLAQLHEAHPHARARHFG